MTVAKPIPAIYNKGRFTVAENLDLPENTKLYLLLIDPISEADFEQLESEQVAADDYFKFEKENNCIPDVNELEYYNRIASNHEAR